MDEKIAITYVSGNAGKISEIKRLNNGYINLSYTNLDLIEIQDTAQGIAVAKCRAAFEIVKGPVLIEDSSLYFSNLGGLPGPYIKDFMKKLDLTSLARLGETKYGSTSAQAKCIYAFYDGYTKPELFIGNTSGKIVYPRSSISDAFGWDPIFELDIELKNSFGGPIRYLTYAEMPHETKDRYSDRYLAFDGFKKYITTFKKYLN